MVNHAAVTVGTVHPMALPQAELHPLPRSDDAAFLEGLTTCRWRVLHLCYRLLGEAADAEDAAQETWLRAHLHRHRYDPDRPLTPWLLSIAAHHCIDQLRRRRQTWLDLEDPHLLGNPALHDPAPTPEAAVLQSERRHELGAILNRLPPTDREVIVLHYWGGRSYAEIANLTGRSVPAVKSRLYRARQRLGEWLRQPPGRANSQAQTPPGRLGPRGHLAIGDYHADRA